MDEIQRHLEQYFKDMQDIEFTIQDEMCIRDSPATVSRCRVRSYMRSTYPPQKNAAACSSR